MWASQHTLKRSITTGHSWGRVGELQLNQRLLLVLRGSPRPILGPSQRSGVGISGVGPRIMPYRKQTAYRRGTSHTWSRESSPPLPVLSSVEESLEHNRVRLERLEQPVSLVDSSPHKSRIVNSRLVSKSRSGSSTSALLNRRSWLTRR